MRIHWIDNLKGFAIILVVIGHQNIPSYLSKYIFSFHMPLFFFISGYLFDFEKYIDSQSMFMKKKIVTLIVPYFSFTLLAYLFYAFFDLINEPKVQNIDLLPNGFLYEILKTVYSGPSLLNYPLWFLTCLFITEMIFYLLLRKYYICHSKFVLIIFLMSIFGYLGGTYLPFRLPFGLDIALTSIVFYTAGYYFRNNKYFSYYKENNYLYLFFILVHLLLFSIFNNYVTEVDVNNLEYGNYFIFYLAAFSGIITYVYLFKRIKSNKFLEFYGKNSLVVLGLHAMVIGVFKHLIKLLDLNRALFEDNIFFIFIFTISTLLLMAPMITIINRHFSFMLGKIKTT